MQFHSFHCIRLSCSPSNILGDCFFTTVYSWFLCHILTDHVSVGLFLSHLIYSIDLCLFLYQYLLFDYCSYTVQFEVMEHGPSSFIILSKGFLGYLVSFVVLYTFYVYFSSVVKKYHWYLIGIALLL